MPTADTAPVAIPLDREVILRRKTGEGRGMTRTYIQSELTIDGEVAIIRQGARAADALLRSGFDLGKLNDLLVGETNQVNWPLAIETLTTVLGIAPGLVAESMAIMFGYFPTREDGTRNPDWDAEVDFIRNSINIAATVDALKCLAEQNDLERLAAPFAFLFRKTMELGESVQAKTPS